MRCVFDTQVFPRNNEDSPNNFYIVRYICGERLEDCELACDEDGNDLYQQVFFAKGYFLPRSKLCVYDLQGYWEKNKKRDGRTFVVESWTETVKQDKASIVNYLSGALKGTGIGIVTINKMFETFGENIFDVIENDPNKLKDIKGISDSKLEKIVMNCNSTRGAKGVVMSLAPYGISYNTAMRIYEKHKDQAVDLINSNPYQFYLTDREISFQVADAIAMKNGLPPDFPDRLSCAILEVLKQAEYGGPLFRMTTGHLCVSYGEVLEKAWALLENPNISIESIKDAYSQLYKDKKVKVVQDPNSKTYYVFNSYVAQVEEELATAIVDILKNSRRISINFDEEIRVMERKEGVSLAPEQKNAVKLGLSNSFAVITGGPGTGKTTIIKFIRNIYMKNNHECKILMCSPTGVAATRMSESTNGEACTVHKALNLRAEEDGSYKDVEELDYDLIIVDETSMLDIYLAKVLLKAVKFGAKLLFIGDVEQLPSVGPGAVLRDIIESGVVPVAWLNKVYRQEDGSLIALNALLIKQGKSSFDYGETFQFIPATDFAESARIMTDIYLKEISVNSIGNVMMLSPFRQRTESGVMALNAIRDQVNPPSPKKEEFICGNKVFRVADKVIQLKNVDDIANGDIGIITNIGVATEKTPDGTEKEEVKVTIDFGHGRIVNYDQDDMKEVDWSYAMTVHKSQGSEANVVIFNILDGHGIMLKRNLLYTAITRAKKKVYIVGSMNAIQIAVNSGVSPEDRRNTMLAQRIKFLMSKRSAE